MELTGIQPTDPTLLSTLVNERARANSGATTVQRKLGVLNQMNPAGGEAPETVDEALVQFQSILVGEMVKAMRATVPEDMGILPKSPAEKMFEGLLDKRYAEELGRNMEGLGLTEALKFQLGMTGDASPARTVPVVPPDNPAKGGTV